MYKKQTSLCLGDSARISLPTDPNGPETYAWTPATGLSRATGAAVQASPAATTTYTVQATSTSGAVRYLGVTVVVLPRPTLGISYGGCPARLDQPVQLQVSPGLSGYTYAWDFGDGTATTAEGTHRYAQAGRYVVRLSATSPGGCPAQATTTIEVSDLKIPNVFTPNGDGINDTFVLSGYAAASLQVFNRWGRRVYVADHYDNTWDGAGQAGGIYYYLAQPADCATPLKGWVELVR